MELMTKQGYNQTEVGLIPEDWELVKLTDVVQYIHGKAHEQDIDENGEYIVANSKFISTNGVVKKFSRKQQCAAQKGDVLTVLSDIPNGKALAKCFYVEENDEITVNQRICIWRTKYADSKYLYYKLNRLPYFLSLNDGVNQTNIGNTDIEKCNLVLPPTLTEQKAIATALSDVDALITSLEQTITKKKAIKQGAMQELLTPPHKGGKRLPGFEGEWVEKTIESLVEKSGLIRGPFGGALKKEFFVQNGYKVYEQKNAIYKSVELGRYFIDDNKFKELKRFEVKENDFILSCSGTIGKMYQIPRRFQKGIINQALLIIRIDNSVSDYKYFEHQFTSDVIQKDVIDDTQGGAMKNLIGMSDFKKATIPYPPTLKEQQAIASILSDMDAEITQLESKKEKYQAIKQGMMQELLTGKTRLV